jgi:hypothetical protein
MKICWDTLEKLRYIKATGNFRIGRGTYYIHDNCLVCGDPFLGQKPAVYCSDDCSKIYHKNNGPMKNKHHTIDAKQKISNSLMGKLDSDETKKKKSDSMWGKIKSEDHLRKISESARIRYINPENNPRYDRYTFNNVPKYDLYTPQLEPIEQCRRNIEDPNILEVKCTYCGKWHIPTLTEVKARIYQGFRTDTHKFYCSSKCKQDCPIYGKVKYPKNNKPYYTRPLQKEWASLVLKQNDNKHICEICGEYGNIAHHIYPVKCNPLESADVDNGIIICKVCHNKVHQISGCTLQEIRRNNDAIH